MNTPPPQLLLVSWQPDGNRLSLTSSEKIAPNTAALFDTAKLTEVLWSELSAAVSKRFHHTFSEADLAATGLPREVVQLHLLVDIYRPNAFPALLAERLARQIAARLWLQHDPNTPALECVVQLSPLAGPPGRLLPLLELELRRHLQSSHSIAPRAAALPTAKISAVFKSWLGAFAGLGVTTLKLGQLAARHTRRVSARDVLPENLFVLFSGHGNHTRHIWRWLDSPAAPKHNAAVLVLGQTALESEYHQRCAAAGIRVFHLWQLRDLPAAALKLFDMWGKLSRLTDRAARDLGLRLGIGFHARAAAWWLRGWLHEAAARRLRFANPGNTLAVFGLIAHADSRLTDRVLRQRGVKTIHWLHGIVEDSLHYQAHSTACLCQNPVDADLRAAHGSYALCLTPAVDLESIPPADEAKSPPAHGTLVVTNLLHPENRFATSGAPESLRQLLELVAKHSAGTTQSPLTWRPHPRENATPEFEKFRQFARQLGFTVDNHASLAGQVRQHRHVIATFSGSVGDVAAAGAVPAIFAGLPYETQGHWGRLPTELKFRTSAELATVLASLTNETNLARLRDQLCAQFNQPPPTPRSIGTALESVRATTAPNLQSKPADRPEVASC